MVDLSAEDLFPTSGPIDEAHQIGREQTIKALVARALDGGDALLVQPRKIGKTSVARAALEHVRTDHEGIVAEIDCTSADITGGPSVARALLHALRDAGGNVSRLLSARHAAARSRSLFDRLRPAAQTATELGAEEGKVAAGVLDLLRLDAPSLDAVLEEITRLGENGTAVVFIDEIQAIANWADRNDVESALRRFLRSDGRRAALIAAGSERTAAEQLFAAGQPLEWEFQPFEVPEIDDVAWHQGIVERFDTVGIDISAARVRQILAETGGQPWKTMLVAKQALRETRGADEREVSWAAVDAAIAEARRHPSWNS